MTSDDVKKCLASYKSGESPNPSVERSAVKYLGAKLVEQAPGNSVEVRVPPYLAVQVVEGVRHRRGTPPASVECNARTFIELMTGVRAWGDALTVGVLFASGERSDLSQLLPLSCDP